MTVQVELAMIVPTRGRPGNIEKVVSAWDFTNAWDVADLYLAIDADDPEARGYYDLCKATRHPDTDEPLFSIVTMDRWMPMVHKLDKVAVGLAESRKYLALGFAGDDHLPRTINWAQTYLAELHRLKTGLVHSDDGYQGANICTEWAVTSDVVRRLGRMIPAAVEHMYSDVSIHDLMTAAGALTYLPQVRIEHMHPIVKKAENDEQYRRVNSREQFASDKGIYYGWRNGRMSEDLAKVKALYPDRIQPVRQGQILRTVTTTRRPVRRSGPSNERNRMSRFPFSREFKEVRGATPDEIGMTLADFAAGVPADQEIVELGVFQGRTALIMAWGAAQGNGAHVTGIDAWDLEGNTYGPPFNEDDSRAWAEYRIRELGYTDRITLVKNFASDAAARWAIAAEEEGRDGQKIGLLFVDDDHSYAGARRAVEDWAPHLAPGAIIAIDDYGHPDWPGVEMAVNDLVAEGVIEPVTIYHERLAVTRLISPSPEQVYQEGIESGLSHVEAQEDAWSQVPEALDLTTVDRPLGGLQVCDPEVSRRGYVQPDELDDVPPGTPVEDLNTVQLRALAKARGISLGVRKDKRSEMLTALAAGE